VGSFFVIGRDRRMDWQSFSSISYVVWQILHSSKDQDKQINQYVQKVSRKYSKCVCIALITFEYRGIRSRLFKVDYFLIVLYTVLMGSTKKAYSLEKVLLSSQRKQTSVTHKLIWVWGWNKDFWTPYEKANTLMPIGVLIHRSVRIKFKWSFS